MRALHACSRSRRRRVMCGAFFACSSMHPGLPLVGDQYTFVPPERDSDPSAIVHVLAYVRRVHGHNLWVWYREKRGAVELVALTATPAA